MKDPSRAIRSMNVLAYATSKGKLAMRACAIQLCKRYGANRQQIITAQTHGRDVAAGIDYPNWKD